MLLRARVAGLPLHEAAGAGHTEIVADLLRGRADPVLRDAARESALLRAARRGFVGIVEARPGFADRLPSRGGGVRRPSGGVFVPGQLTRRMAGMGLAVRCSSSCAGGHAASALSNLLQAVMRPVRFQTFCGELDALGSVPHPVCRNMDRAYPEISCATYARR